MRAVQQPLDEKDGRQGGQPQPHGRGMDPALGDQQAEPPERDELAQPDAADARETAAPLGHERDGAPHVAARASGS